MNIVQKVLSRRRALVGLTGTLCSAFLLRIGWGCSRGPVERSVKRSVALFADELDRGTPILPTIEKVIENADNARVRSAFTEMLQTIKEGGSFLESLERYPDLFPKSFRDVFDTEDCQELAWALREASRLGYGCSTS